VIGPESYGETFADVYDDWYGDVSDVAATVASLRALAGDGPVLELGVGTGRIALPLAATGTVVDGIDASPAMLAILAAKDPTSSVRAVLGDMAAPSVEGPYRAVFATFNTFFNLWRADDQARCVGSAAAMLSPDGVFAVEVFVPDAAAGPVDGEEPEHVDERDDGAGGLVIRRTRRDRTTQTVRGVLEHHRDDGAVVARDWIIRYLSPTQLDELCADAGLVLWRRWADWSGSPFLVDGSTHHVSVYRRA
jgi:SAM-dependent methyltransferase